MDAHYQLEYEFGAWTGTSNLVSCSSGTSALHLALEAFQLPPGSEVLVPEFTMVACARAVTMAGLKPVFVDCNDSLLMDPELCSQAITPTTRVIMPVHIYGRSCDMVAISRLASEHDLFVVEDCAEYHGGILSGLSDAYCWSFYRNKIVHGEEGGMIAFDNPRCARWATLLRCQGFTSDHDFLHVPRGVNARMSDSHALAVLKSLHQADANLKKRWQVVQWYNEVIPEEWYMPEREVCWVYDIRLPEGVLTKDLIFKMNRFGIAARWGFKPMSMQPEYEQAGYERLNAFRLSREVMYLPVDPSMTQENVNEIAALLQRVIG